MSPQRMIQIAFFDYTTLLGYAIHSADDEDWRRSVQKIVERVNAVNDTAPERSLMAEIQHKDDCPRGYSRGNSFTLPRCTCYPQDAVEIAERKESVGGHLRSCTGFGSYPAVGGLCTCDASGWLTRRAAAQGEARERVKPRDQ